MTRQMSAEKRGASTACAAGVRKDDQSIQSRLSLSIAHRHLRALDPVRGYVEDVLGLWGDVLARMFRRCGIPDFARKQPIPRRVKRINGAHADRERAAKEGIVFGRREASFLSGALYVFARH
jgi:hypothetical protein